MESDLRNHRHQLPYFVAKVQVRARQRSSPKPVTKPRITPTCSCCQLKVFICCCQAPKGKDWSAKLHRIKLPGSSLHLKRLSWGGQVYVTQTQPSLPHWPGGWKLCPPRRCTSSYETNISGKGQDRQVMTKDPTMPPTGTSSLLTMCSRKPLQCTLCLHSYVCPYGF